MPWKTRRKESPATTCLEKSSRPGGSGGGKRITSGVGFFPGCFVMVCLSIFPAGQRFVAAEPSGHAAFRSLASLSSSRTGWQPLQRWWEKSG